MSKIRINDLARELEIKSSTLIQTLPLAGVTEKKTHSSSIEDWEADKVRGYVEAHADVFYPKQAASQIVAPRTAMTAIPVAAPLAVDESSTTLTLPESFSFYGKGFIDFDHVLRHFDLDPGASLTIDLSRCGTSNFQVLALLVQYAWYLKTKGCNVTFKYGSARAGSTKMLTAMGALRLERCASARWVRFYQPSREKDLRATQALRRPKHHK